ncbi:hypothetical protein, partial [Klebsiella pneumoniae]|uniref:hypothetical protein n=1 Tax=Klebsiella pneumoniae TaxID=573 RepID=UPI0030140879
MTTAFHRGWAEALQAEAKKIGHAKNLNILRRDRPYFNVADQLIHDESFDLLLIDGRERMQCLNNSIS